MSFRSQKSTSLRAKPTCRCEERSDEAIPLSEVRTTGLLRPPASQRQVGRLLSRMGWQVGHSLLRAGCLVLLLSGCANYASRVRQPRLEFEMGHYLPAIAQLKEHAERHDNDELLYLMDLGIVYHTAG